MSNKYDWFSLYSRFLVVYANAHYLKWKKTKPSGYVENKDNPCKLFSYSQPSCIREIIDAMNNDDEEKVKSIFMVESQYDPMMLECRNIAARQLETENEN